MLVGRVISIGRNVLTKLANSKQRGGDGAAERSAGQGIVPKMVAGLIRERGAHAVVWHPIQKRYQFASDFHASAAIELLSRGRKVQTYGLGLEGFFDEADISRVIVRHAPCSAQLESKQSGFRTGSSLKPLQNSQGFL